MYRWLFVLAILIGLGVFAYRTGSALAEREVAHLRSDIGRLTRTADRLRADNDRLKEIADKARAEMVSWQRRYRADAPTGTRRKMLALIDKQLAAGADPARLRFLIGAAAEKTACSGQPVTKRFLVRTPISVGPASAVTFADGRLTVTAEGSPARDADGRVEAWFDPAQPLTIHFRALNGATSDARGSLPLHHSAVVGKAEYRFNIVGDERRGFVQVTGDRCDLPGG